MINWPSEVELFCSNNNDTTKLDGARFETKSITFAISGDELTVTVNGESKLHPLFCLEHIPHTSEYAQLIIAYNVLSTLDWAYDVALIDKL